ncbi:IspD/TarI family cytidylyltransferase, partial [Paracidovorax cattleyae]
LGGLRALRERGAEEGDWVLVHDAARCLVTTAQIDALIDACEHDSVGGLLAHKLADTLKTASGGPGGVRVASTVDRSDKWLAQTPQMFRLGTLESALVRYGAQATDEASAMEAMGLHPRLVPGGAQNFKVTYPDDFALAEAVLAQRLLPATLERFGGPLAQGAPLPGKTFF